MTDVIHDPTTDWCACEPNSAERCDYRLLADQVVASLNPPDADQAEVSICVEAVGRITDFVAALPCMCTGDDPCGRCAALGQWQGRPVGR